MVQLNGVQTQVRRHAPRHGAPAGSLLEARLQRIPWACRFGLRPALAADLCVAPPQAHEGGERMKIADLPQEIVARFREGLVIPAHPLTLDEEGAFDRRHQRALSR